MDTRCHAKESTNDKMWGECSPSKWSSRKKNTTIARYDTYFIIAGFDMWKDAITSSLWSYAMRKACDNLNNIPHHTKTKSPLEKFSGVNIIPNINYNQVSTVGQEGS
jgi:hypothetical protein